MESEKQVLRRNIKLLYALNFFTNSEFILPIYILFGRKYLGLSYFQAGSFFLVAWFVSIACDFLGGLTADRIGRKHAYMAGTTLQMLSFIPFVFSHSYALLLLSSVVYGVGLALSSNSIDALVYEQAVAMDAKDVYQHSNATTQVFVFTGRVYATAIGGLAYKLDPRLPYLLYVIVLGLALWAGSQIRLRKAIDHEAQPKSRALFRIALKVYRTNHGLIKFICIGALANLWGNILFSYYQPYFINLHVSATTLGILFAVISIASAYGAHLMRRLPDHLSAHAILSLELLCCLATGCLLMLTRLPYALAAPLFVAVASGFIYPVMRLYVNGHATNAARASVLSLATTIFSIGEGLGFLFAYYMADHASARRILLVVVVGASLTLLANHIIRPKETVTTTV